VKLRTYISHVFVEFIPEQLEPGVLYVSRRYSTASHLCCCGCGLKVVTPLNPAKWRLIDRNGTISLHPSIGNWGFPCKSHYWIEGSSVRWAGAMSKSQIARVRALDQRDAALIFGPPAGRVAEIGRWIAGLWRKVVRSR
jgi:hypothetical protein